MTDLASELVVGHGDLDVLDDRHLDVLDGLLAGVVDGEVGLDLLPVVVELLVQRHLHVELAGGEREPLADQGGGLTLAAADGGVLHLADSQSHRVTAVGLLIRVVAHEHTQLVDHTQGLGLYVYVCVEEEKAQVILRWMVSG